MNFADAVEQMDYDAEARTQNGMKAFEHTSDKVLDYFSVAGSSRRMDVSQEFINAIAENEDLAMRALLWVRDVRGGAGERGQFRRNLQALEKSRPKLAGQIMHMVPEVGRWDDLFAYQNPINVEKAFDMIGQALRDGNALCAKWMPRKGESAVKLRTHLGMSPKQYRKTLVGLTDVVESYMCAKEWSKIDFSKLPSLAAARYQKAFEKNAPKEYATYINSLQKGEAKINAGAVYPYDVVLSCKRGNEAVANAQWDALPDYIPEGRKIFPIVDVSGSMSVRATPSVSAMDIAISLGLYVAERNKSDFKNLWMTFSSDPRIEKISGKLSDRIRAMRNNTHWGMSTNLHAAFGKLLDVAKRGKVSQDDMPDTLLIMSDMQFNYCVNYDDRAQKMIERKYREAGYKVPQIVYWNLSMYQQGNVPVKFDERGTALVSGFSPAILTSVLAGDLEEFTPKNVMLKTLMNDRYNWKE
jgi:hypothetical protein